MRADSLLLYIPQSGIVPWKALPQVPPLGGNRFAGFFALRVTDMEKLFFYSTCFSSARGTATMLPEKVFWFALPVLVFLLAGF